MKKIIYIHNNYEPEHVPRKPDSEDRFYTYGFGSNLARNFKRFYPEYTVEMWRLDGFTNNYYEKEVQGVKHRVFPAVIIKPFGEFSLKFVWELKKELKKTKSLLFISHIHTWLTYQVSFFFGKKHPIVCSHHGDWSPFFRITMRKGFRKLKDFVDIQVEKRLLKRIDYFLLCDFFQIPYLEKACPKIRYTIFSSGLDVDKMITIPKNAARKKIGWEPDKKYILYVGRLYNLKQPKELIDIWKEIKKERPEIKLVVIGNSDDDEFNEYAIESGVIVLGRILNSELDKYYSASDVYVLMALRKDYFGGTGIAPLESLACNTPVVSYSMRNYIGNNMDELGEVPDTLEGHKEAILKVINNPNHYKNMRESMKKYYSLEAVASKAQAVFEELMNLYDFN